MSACDQEMCPNWSGDGDVCPCSLFDLDRPASLDCADCGHTMEDHNAPDHGGGCYVCGIDCGGWS